VVAKSHKGEPEFKDDRGVNKGDLFLYGIGDPVGARGRGGGRLGEGHLDFLCGEGDS